MIVFEEYKKITNKGLEEKYNRYIWVKEKEIEYQIEGRAPKDINSIYLYHNATCAYINGCFLASILSVSSAIEQFLLWYVEKESKLKGRIYRQDVLDNAEKTKLLTKSLRDEFNDYNSKCRDAVAHAKTRFGFYSLGFKYNPNEGDYGGIDQELIVPGPEHCTKKGLILFMKIAKNIFDKTK